MTTPDQNAALQDALARAKQVSGIIDVSLMHVMLVSGIYCLCQACDAW